jgi:pyrimidine-nucleoside phosphorylase
LESIPGYRTDLSPEEFLTQVEKVGMAVIGQTGNLTPADKKLYALRDVTATVDSVPLIASSIMSKKLAAGSHAIVLDVKVGSGAFMKTPEEAEQLATSMVEIGRLCGRRMAALLTNMDSPLGNAVGNALEVQEAVGVLKGTVGGDLRQVCCALATQMVALVFDLPEAEATARVEEALTSGAAYEKMKEWIAAQGGDVRYIEDDTLFPTARYRREVTSPVAGYLTAMDAEAIGGVGVLLGAGRAAKEDAIDHSAGILIAKKVGDRVEKGEVLCTLLTNREEVLADATRRYTAALTFGDTAPAAQPLIYKTII